MLQVTATEAVAVSAALSLAGLFAIGALITLFTGRGALYSGGTPRCASTPVTHVS